MKKAIIIGATSGIGQEVAKSLIQDGWQRIMKREYLRH